MLVPHTVARETEWLVGSLKQSQENLSQYQELTRRLTLVTQQVDAEQGSKRQLLEESVTVVSRSVPGGSDQDVTGKFLAEMQAYLQYREQAWQHHCDLRVAEAKADLEKQAVNFAQRVDLELRLTLKTAQEQLAASEQAA